MSKLVLRNRIIVCKNFSGQPSRYNREGDRNFLLILQGEEAVDLKRQGYNVKQFKPSDDGTEGSYYMPVAVNVGVYRKPKIVLVDGNHLTQVDVTNAKQMAMLDHVDVDSVDISIDPYKWIMDNGQSGIKAYLSTLYIKVREDEFAKDYEKEGYIDANVDIPSF